MNETSYRFSIIIATYNRCEMLEGLLRSLDELKFDRKNFEVIVVDNNSTDATEIITKSCHENFGYTLKYIYESKSGLSNARNRGIRESVYEYIAFIDDDVRVPSMWLNSIKQTLINMDAQCCGGKVLLSWPQRKPKWLKKEFFFLLSELDKGDRDVLFETPNEYPVGANMTIKRELFELYGMFRPELGRVKQSLMSGEESELFERIASANINIAYSAEGFVEHIVLSERLCRKFFIRRFALAGKSHALTVMYLSQKKRSVFLLITIVKFILFLLLAFFGSIRGLAFFYFCRTLQFLICFYTTLFYHKRQDNVIRC